MGSFFVYGIRRAYDYKWKTFETTAVSGEG